MNASVDPIVVEIVEGTLASAEAEVEAAIERTARSPMIREARDFRAGIHDRHCRKLTGRSYSALVQPIVRDFPIATIQPGDVFFHNDVYQSEGGIGHLPDLCVTVPVHHDGEVVAFVQAFGHHDDIGGCVPGSMPSHGTSFFQEGLIVPPVRLYAAGEPNTDLMRVMVRNSRLPDSLRGDLDAEVAACRMGADRVAELSRCVPLSLYMAIVKYSLGGEIASLFYGDAGSVNPLLTTFLGAPVLDVAHIAAVTESPGIGVIFCRFQNQLRLSVIYASPILRDEEAAEFAANLRRRLLNP